MTQLSWWCTYIYRCLCMVIVHSKLLNDHIWYIPSLIHKIHIEIQLNPCISLPWLWNKWPKVTWCPHQQRGKNTKYLESPWKKKRRSKYQLFHLLVLKSTYPFLKKMSWSWLETYWCLVSREISGMIPVITSNNHLIPPVPSGKLWKDPPCYQWANPL